MVIIITPIQSGAVTHHQLQAIMLQSLSIKNTTNNNTGKLIIIYSPNFVILLQLVQLCRLHKLLYQIE